MTKSIYIAGPLFSQAERNYLEIMVGALSERSDLDPEVDFFLPHRDGGELGRCPTHGAIFELDVRHLDAARIVVALLDGQDCDSGTCIELGYAYARGKKIYGLLTDFRAYIPTDNHAQRPNIMVWGVCENGKTLFTDLESLAKAFMDYRKELR